MAEILDEAFKQAIDDQAAKMEEAVTDATTTAAKAEEQVSSAPESPLGGPETKATGTATEDDIPAADSAPLDVPAPGFNPNQTSSENDAVADAQSSAVDTRAPDSMPTESPTDDENTNPKSSGTAAAPDGTA